jgi:phosphoglycolate phosphatase
MSTKKIVIFDMDGTLINSSRDITISINAVREQIYGLSALEEQFVIDAINAHERNLAELFYKTSIYEESAKDLFESHYYEQCIQNVYPYEGILESLEDLRASGCLMSVATNAPSQFAKRMLDHLGMSDFFGLIIGSDDVDQPKPHPQMIKILLAHHKYDMTCDSAWMIGDNSKDMQAAQNANIGTIFAAWGFSTEGKGDAIAFNPLQVNKIILEE